MRRSATTFIILASVSLLVVTGCQSAGDRFLSWIGIQKDPLVVALVAEQQRGGGENPLQALNPFAPYGRWRVALKEELGRPISLDLGSPWQLEPALKSGLFHLAVVSTAHYVNLAEPARFRVLAVPTDQSRQTLRPAVLITAEKSPIKAVTDLRGKTVAFGPARDARTHQAGLELLARHGLQKTDLSLEVLPLVGSLKHLPTMRAVAQTVMNLSSDAGFIDEAAWAALPNTTEERDEPCHSRLRILARTVAVPDQLILASPTLDDGTLEQLRAILLAVGQKHPEALKPLFISGYTTPDQDLLETLGKLVALREAASSK
ncbi:MAG: PhnD/SsuA/transferrin family substrate-binding protein [Planctomycetota bacterium]